MNCQHLLCSLEANEYQPHPKAQVQHWCDDHAHEGGFCFRCGSFEAGHSEFEMVPDHLCLECQKDLAKDDCPEDEPSDYGDDLNDDLP